ncbi:DUF6327 family protein [Haloflavibacter putidus]|uniref:Uncharacterized protein n=1 Tax=Haloflavibacter putidus TaxID=2576776 RepID=A0A507ZSF0_9FLAO|nr:DUF6327 family protein [Haloflavibacter putidus]TQD40726.1 hypothetical protein FKR84_01740 [Haloflavibacter putidus]
MKTYKSYHEVNHDLKILRLQTQIDKEKIKLSINDVKEDLSPINIATNVAVSIAKKALILKAVNKILGIQKAKIVGKTRS